MENREQPPVRCVQTRTVYADGREEQKSEMVICEHALDLVIDGKPFARIICTRRELREMIVGRLLTQRLIGGADDIEELSFTEDETKAEVRIRAGKGPRALYRIEQTPAWRSEWVFALARRFQTGMPLHDETFSTHSAFLMRKGEILYGCEDISRHNAVDKVIGHALTGGVPLSTCILFTSGRVPKDMTEKTVAAGIPMLVTKAAASADAIRFAREYGLTLICHARESGFVVNEKNCVFTGYSRG